MNVSGQIMLNATYMHNQMTYLWQGPQITVCKCTFIILQFRVLKRRTELVDPELQQIHLSCVWCVAPPVFSLGLGDREFGLWWQLQQLEACSCSQHLEPFCWLCIAEFSRHFLSAPCFLCNKPLVGGLKPSEIQLYKGIPIWLLRLTFITFTKRGEQGRELAIQLSKLHISFPSDYNPCFLALWVCCEC